MALANRRYDAIDKAKGLAIIFVVLGHIVAREGPAGNDWIMQLKAMIYKFHMPVFMAISGTVLAMSLKPMHSAHDLMEFIRARAERLIPGFILFALIIWLGKLGAASFMKVDNAPQDTWYALLTIFTDPAASSAGSLWYVYVLLQLTIVFAIYRFIWRQNLTYIVIFSAAIHLVQSQTIVPSFLGIRLFCEYAWYFAIGAVIAKHYVAVSQYVVTWRILFFSLFFLSFATIPITTAWQSKWIIGMTAIPAIYAFVGSVKSKQVNAILLVLGGYTLCIYLMNTIMIGLTKGLMLKLLPWDYSNFLIYFVALTSAGLIGPIIFYRTVLQHVPYLNRVTN